MAYTFLNGYSFSLRLTCSYDTVPAYYFEIVEWSTLSPRSCCAISHFRYDLGESWFNYSHIGHRPHESRDGISAYFDFYQDCDAFLESLDVHKYPSLYDCIQQLYPEALL